MPQGVTLSLLRASCLIAGAGMGTGVLSMPLAAEGLGLGSVLLAISVAAGASLLVYLVLSELTRRSDPPAQLLNILSRHLFTGRWAKGFRTVFFVLFTFLLFQCLTTYVIAGSQALEAMSPVSGPAAMGVFCAAGLATSLFGLRTVAAWETVSVSLIAVTIVALTVLSTGHHARSIPLRFGQPLPTISLFAVFMYAFSAIFAVVQVAGHVPLAVDLRKALVIGLAINVAGTLAFVLAALTASDVVTPVATIGLAASLTQPMALVASSVFVLLAMLTSFWPALIAFADVVHEATGIQTAIGQWMAAVPSLLMAALLPLALLDYVELGAGAISLVIILLIIPAYRNAIARDPEAPRLLGHFGGSRAVLVALGLIGTTMAIGGLL